MSVIQINQVSACTVGTNKQSHRTQTARRCFEALCGKDSMKVVVQNGSQHPITRKEMEAIIQVIPNSLVKGISSICLYHSESGEPDTTFFDKPKTLGFYGYANVSNLKLKLEALEELAFSLIILRDTGHIPFKLSKGKRSLLAPEVDTLLDKWKAIVEK